MAFYAPQDVKIKELNENIKQVVLLIRHPMKTGLTSDLLIVPLTFPGILSDSLYTSSSVLATAPLPRVFLFSPYCGRGSESREVRGVGQGL